MNPMNSRLYECRVMHHRLSPIAHKFDYGVFMFYLDLDELDALSRSLLLFSRNRPNVFNFRDDDHAGLGAPSVKSNILRYLEQNGISLNDGKIFLLTHTRTFGYVFNPVSFYFCFDSQGKPVCAIAEVSNTFREMKLYLLGSQDLRADGNFHKTVPKHFYVSPFMDLEIDFEFKLRAPEQNLMIAINDLENGKPVLLSSLTGRRRELSDAALILMIVKYPLLTLRIIFLIHWHALRLLLKGLPYLRKSDRAGLQTGLLNPHASILPKGGLPQ